MPRQARLLKRVSQKDSSGRPCCDFETEKLCRKCRSTICPEHTCQCAQCSNFVCPDCLRPTLLPTVGVCRFGCPPGAQEAEQLRRKMHLLIEDAYLIDDALGRYVETVETELKKRITKLGLT
jgi:hypothetical protein